VGMYEVRRVFRVLVSTLGSASACVPYVANPISELTSTHFFVHDVITTTEQDSSGVCSRKNFKLFKAVSSLNS
jgi:hypothetical protein